MQIETKGTVQTPDPTRAVRFILVVDDEPDIVEGLAVLLESELPDTAVLSAKDAAGALEVLKTDQPIDVVLTDYRMPGMNGIDMVRAVRRLRPGLPCILLTAYTSLDVVAQAIDEARFDGVFSKPADFEKLKRFISLAIHRAGSGYEYS